MANFKFEPASDKTTITYLDTAPSEIWIRLDKDDKTVQVYPTTQSSAGWAAVVPDTDVKEGMTALVGAYPTQASANDKGAMWLGAVFHVFNAKSGTVTVVRPQSQRLRVSIFHFNSTLVTGMSGSDYTWNDPIFDGLVDARIDDYTMIANVGFDVANPLKPRWIGAPGGKPYDPAANIAFLKQAVDKMHSKNIQFCAGFVMVKPSAPKPDPSKPPPPPGPPDSGPPFANLLSNQPDKIPTFAKNLVGMFKDNGINIDGINFDFENDALSDNRKGMADGMRALIQATAQEMKEFNGGWVAYDGAPFQTADGANEMHFMNVQPYSLAGLADNIIARPQCYSATATSPAWKIKQGIKCALAPTGGAPAGSGPKQQGDDAVTVGGGLKSSALQMAIWGTLLSKPSMEEFCTSTLRPAGVGLCIYPGRQLDPGLFPKAKAWEAALNPGAAAPGKSGQPLQVPRK